MSLDLSLSVQAEQRFFEVIRNSQRPIELFQRFGVQYHFFSLHQVHAFCGIFRLFEPTDRETAAILSKVVYEELGEGKENRIHSVLLENFLDGIGVDCSALPINRDHVVTGVREYVDALYSAFWGDSLTRALATYCFLENSALNTYPALVELLTELGVSKQCSEFFELHSCLEIEHAAAASRLASRLVTKPEDIILFNNQFSEMNIIWERFWDDINAYTTS